MPLFPPPPAARRAFGVYIGRFEPPHLAHLGVMLEALQSVDTLIVVIGSACAARNTKNPFTAAERETLIRAMLQEAGVDTERLRFVGVRDNFYNESLWLSDVQAGVGAHTGGSTDVALVGHFKDESSYYLRSFPAWTFLPTQVVSTLSATNVRRALFGGHLDDLSGMVPPAVEAFLRDFHGTPEYAALREEAEYLSAFRAAWRAAPTPPVFVTANALVTRSGHVLLVRRDTLPGRGNLALPGGFLGPGETLLNCAVRQVREETGLEDSGLEKTGLGESGLDGGLPLPITLSSTLRSAQVFDYPERSGQGRVVTHAFHFDLGMGALPALRGGGDAAEALWRPLPAALGSPELFFEDHHAIIEHFLSNTF